MALSAWKATAQQSISDSAIQSSVKGMQKKEGRGGEKGRWNKKKIKERHQFYSRDRWSRCPCHLHPSSTFLLQPPPT